MPIRKYWFFPKTIKYVSLDDFESEPGCTRIVDPNIPDISISPGDEMLLLYRNLSCPGCGSMNVVRNGTFIRTLETGIRIRVRDTCAIPVIIHWRQGHTIIDTASTSLRIQRRRAWLAGSRYPPEENSRVPAEKMQSSCYFVYDEQHVHIDGIERYMALLKDTKTGNFVEEILDDLKEEMLARFFTRAISCFTVPETIFITTDGYHYETVLETVASRLWRQ